MKTLRSVLAAALLATSAIAPLLAPPASAQVAAKVTPKGDWTGDLVTPQLTYKLGVHIDEASAGKFTGTIGSHQTGRWGTALEELSFAGDALTFRVPTTSSVFKGAWDPAASAWVGTYTSPGGSFPLKLAAGKVAPLPTVAGVDGRWEGALDVQGIKLRLVLRAITDEHGSRILMDSPDQMTSNIVTSKLTRTGSLVAFDVPSIQGHYEGDLSADGGTISGTWTQIGQGFPLIMTRVSMNAALPTPVRPQTPKKPYPYKDEDVEFDNPKAPGVRLACTLTTPNTAGRHPAALLITGSGAQDRNETLLGHQIFGVLADHLTRKGIAVLRCDDRGYGKSTGKFAGATATEFSTDAEAAVGFLRTRADIDPKRIGLVGHSEGSITGPMLAARDPGIAYVVMMGGVGAKGVDLMTEQRTLITGAMGLAGSDLTLVRAFSRAMFQAVVDAPDDASAKTAAADLLLATGAGGVTQEIANSMAEQFASHYMRVFLAYDPAPVLSQVKAPVLAVTGSKDLQVPAAQNLPLIKSTMAANPDVTIVELPGLNHMFQTAKTGGPSEYAEIEETFAPAALNTISDWIVKRMKP